ncbi:MAG: class I SAM-dependent methyltransferase [Crocinitomicaceae bacterium]|nr:class I SAM-dependent methyltransferase [Crocinitomicaceae bacterium]MCF8434115.1 class I SAM-dependent methyltransferase [Crocinitomicaceae bacterium]
MKQKEWFAEWFDTSYYHTLYKNRDEEEAANFISRLIDDLKLPKSSYLLDLACGKGRHSITLNQLGYPVKGVDLSPNSITEANKSSNEHLKFAVQDMREAIPNEKFDAIFNLFTSFGYFDSIEDNIRVVQAMKSMLNEDGILVIDFMNATKVIDSLVLEEEKIIDGIEFHIERKYDGQHIFKFIHIKDGESVFDYSERVQALKQVDFEKLLSENGFEILRTFGDFNLNPFQEKSSDRLIIIAKKIEWKHL